MTNGERKVFTCHCGGYHYLDIWAWDDKDFSDWSVCFVERPQRLRDRLRAAYKALRGQDVFSAELYPADAKKFVEAVKKLPLRK